MNKVLVTGGAGYIGSFMTKKLIDEGYDVVVIDSLERGNKGVLDPRARFEQLNILDKDKVSNLFRKEQFNSVVHFAGYISMEESVRNPGIYFNNNTAGALDLIENSVKNNVKSFIFSSTAGIYGNPTQIPIPEDSSKNPTNPYGESKLMVERMLSWYREAYGLCFASLRYFNAAGAALDASMGEDHKPETHIIPNAIKAALNNSEFVLYGHDYNTPDKTCIRDYIHVIDLAQAHVLVLKRLESDNGGLFYNAGIGRGYSNKEIIEMVERVSGIKLKLHINERRPGDAEVLIADHKKIQNELGFKPQYSDLETIVRSAWEWHKKI